MWDKLSRAEQDDVLALIRSSVILTGLATVPVGLIMGLFGPFLGFLALAVSIPLSAHLGGVILLGPTLARAWEAAQAEPRQVLQVSGLSALFWPLIVSLVPEEVAAVPVLSLLIGSLYATALYVLGMRGDPDTVLSRVGTPVLLLGLGLTILF
jgi:hypothetical protein